MRRLVQQHSALLQLLVLIFGLNASLGYGACCVDVSSGDSGAVRVEAVTANESLFPCHQKNQAEPILEVSLGEQSLSLADAYENCCAACVTAIPLKQFDSNATGVEAQDYLALFSLYVFSNIETPYRPPSRSTS